MKNFYLFAASLFLIQCIAQAPQKMSYQAVIRNSNNSIVSSAPVGMKISLLRATSNGPVVYSETQTVTTNINGLVSLVIGAGTPVSGTFASINWANGPYFIKTETDTSGGTSYNITGTTELLSVPYALYSANSANATVSGFTHYLGESFNGGIIFYLYKGSDGLEHGLIVAPTEGSVFYQWQVQPTFLVNANRTWDGAYNTNLMTSSPAANYIATLGPGWYLPSIDELALLFYNRYSAQKGLSAGGHTLISNTEFYWSSTEFGSSEAYIYYFFTGYANNTSKTNFHKTRAIKAF